jgi:hypothetical protein
MQIKVIVGALCHGCGRKRLTFESVGLCLDCVHQAIAMLEFGTKTVKGKLLNRILAELQEAECWSKGFDIDAIALGLAEELDAHLKAHPPQQNSQK